MQINVGNDLINQVERNQNYTESESNINANEFPNKKSDIEILNDMGFDRTMINKVYIILNPGNIERAIDYMTEINGIYQHNFLESTNPNEKNLCFICNNPEQNHINYRPDDTLINTETSNIFIENSQILVNINKNNQENTTNKNIIDNDNIFGECLVCYENINQYDKELNSIKCGHLFCFNCWFNYLKTLIIEAKVDEIKCMEQGCNEIITEEFIINHISGDVELIKKYNKFKKKAEILKDKNKRICPNPDCDSFLQRNDSSKYVKCENGHEYCFECLNPPHGNKKCDNKSEKKFMKWIKRKKAKRCPKCQMYTQKNEGCNHMTCVHCNYQWCWICEEEYKPDHYSSGKCQGQQFTRVDNLNEVESNRNMFGIHKIFRCVFPKIYGPVNFGGESIKFKYLLIILFWLFGFTLLFFFVTIIYLEKHGLDNKFDRTNAYCFILLTGLTLLIPFQIIFFCSITPFILISLIYHHFFSRLLFFYGFGEFEENLDY